MPKRQNTARFTSEAVQGDGSYVILSKFTVKEAKDLYANTRQEGSDQIMDIGFATLISHVIEWNWVDDSGQPLPMPRDKPEILDSLTTDEVNFLAECLTGAKQAKN